MNKVMISIAMKIIMVSFILQCVNLYPRSKRNIEFPWHSLYKHQYPELMSKMYQGDILLPDNGNPMGKNGLKIESLKWPKGQIPYIFHEKYPSEEKEKVLVAMKRLESETCIKFVPLKTRIYNSYIEISNSKPGCFAMIGYQRMRNGQGLPVNFQIPECTKHQGTIEHELLHVMGLLHEQARSDRDKYVKIVWENIDKTYWSDFNKASEREVSAYGVPYDYKSVMHYPSKAFSKNGKDTLVAKGDPKTELGQRIGATKGDLEKINQMYCKKKGPTSEENEVDEVEDNRYLDTLMEYLD